MEGRNWDRSGNRTHLRIEGVDRLTGDIDIHTTVRLSGVISADLCFSPSLDTDHEMGRRAMYLMQAVPNERVRRELCKGAIRGYRSRTSSSLVSSHIEAHVERRERERQEEPALHWYRGHWPFSIVVSRRLRIWWELRSDVVLFDEFYYVGAAQHEECNLAFWWNRR